MSTTAPQPDPLPPMAAALKAAMADYAVRHPDRAGDQPWAWLSDPDKLEEFRQSGIEAARIRRALEDGATPEELGLAQDTPARILAERGLA